MKMIAPALLVTAALKEQPPGFIRNPENPRERFLDVTEIGRLSNVLDEHKNQRMADVIRLLMLTGARRGEVLNATWDQFDLEQAVWTKPAATTKQRRLHRTPILGAAVQLLRTIRTRVPEAARIAAIREILDRAYGKPTQFLAQDNDILPEDLSAAEIRAEIVAQFQAAFPEYRLLKIVPAASETRPRRRQTLKNETNMTLIGSANEPEPVTSQW